MSGYVLHAWIPTGEGDNEGVKEGVEVGLRDGSGEGSTLGETEGEILGNGEKLRLGEGVGFVVVSHDATPRVVHRTKICAHLFMGQFPIRERARAKLRPVSKPMTKNIAFMCHKGFICG